MLNALTVDLEDWYQGLEIERKDWHAFEDRILLSGRRLLAVLAESGTRGTFFVLGHVAERHPDLVREIHAAGHEIGTHGDSHEFVYRMTPELFPRRDSPVSRAGCRISPGSPFSGIAPPSSRSQEQSLWALDVLAELGLPLRLQRLPGSKLPLRHPGCPALALSNHWSKR